MVLDAKEEAVRAASDPPAQRTWEVTVCGTYRRALSDLERDMGALAQNGCTILSPRSVQFTKVENGFAFAAGEESESPPVIEGRHLAAISRSDFVWLHAPDEIGRASCRERV